MKKDSSQEMKRYNLLHGEIESTYHDVSLKFGVSDSISKILYAICSFGDYILLTDICRNTGLSKQTINSALRKLESENIVCLEAVDGKSKKVCLTEKGKQFTQKNAVRLIEIENTIFESWSDSDVHKYLELTERFLLSLKEKVEQL